MLCPTELLTRNYFDCIRVSKKYLSDLSLIMTKLDRSAIDHPVSELVTHN